jgi:3-oxoacyl-[acyl-carrier protein] reductase
LNNNVKKNRAAIVTGSGGLLGGAIVKKLLAEGISVLATDYDEVKGRLLVDQFKSDGMNIAFCGGDLASYSDIEKICHECKTTFGSIDIIVNNARPKLTLQTFPEAMNEWQVALDILLSAPALIVKAAFSELILSKGVVVNISSTNSSFISHQPLSYHVAKAAVDQLTRYLAYQLGPNGIRVNSVCPGLIEANVSSIKSASIDGGLGELITEAVVPLGRKGKTEEIADLVLFLASSSASYINGQAITIDGGMTLGCQYNSAFQSIGKMSHKNTKL